jgi:peptidoglycan/LPS O-acetylase OafA/YrhL
VADATLKSNHLRYLDGWRGCAILLVLVGHFNPMQMIAGHWIYTARLGVECFFVLSGRLMAEILFVQRMPLGKFYWRRATRILPALSVFVLAMLALGKTDSLSAIYALTFIGNYYPLPDFLGHIWSLCVEEHAYLFLSLIAIWSRFHSINVPCVLAIFSSICVVNGFVQTTLFHRDYAEVYLHTDVRGASILMASALYLWLRPHAMPGYVPILFAALGLSIGIYDGASDIIKYTVGTFCLAVAIATVDSAWRWTLAILSNRILVQFGLMSFSLYLWQQPFYIIKSSFHLQPILLGLFSASLVSFYLIEKPMRSFLNSIWMSRTTNGHALTAPATPIHRRDL